MLTLNAANGERRSRGLDRSPTRSAWGTYARGRSVAGVGERRRSLGQDVTRSSKVHPSAGRGGAKTLRYGAFYLVGRDAGADAIKALKPGDVGLR